MSTLPDTICACATSLPSPIAVIRVSGSETLELFSKVFKGFVYQPNRIQCVNLSLKPLSDEVMIWASSGPQTFTGEDYGELMVHGGPEWVRQVLKYLVSLGARLAEPGEFSYRAFLQGKISVSSALGIGAILNSKTQYDLAAIACLKNNQLHTLFVDTRQSVIRLHSALQMTLDYTEQGYETNEIGQEIKEAVVAFGAYLKKMHDTLGPLAQIAQTPTLVIAGEPNVGKSTLFNQVVGYDRALMSPIAGTTRDYISSPMSYEAFRFDLIDTAGLRETQDDLEKMGIQETESCLEKAQGIILVCDIQNLNLKKIERFCMLHSQPLWILGNKADLCNDHQITNFKNTLSQLALTFSHMRYSLCSLKEKNLSSTELLPHLTSNMDSGCVTPGSFPEPVRTVCEDLLSQGHTCVDEIQKQNYDLGHMLLDRIRPKLALLTGEIKDEAIYDHLFASFCLGK